MQSVTLQRTVITVHLAYCFSKAMFGVTGSHNNANDDQTDTEHWKKEERLRKSHDRMCTVRHLDQMSQQ
jgi:hypothetical protein